MCAILWFLYVQKNYNLGKFYICVLCSALAHITGEALRTFTDSNKKIPAISREGREGIRKHTKVKQQI